jgi:hypothetical protein
MEEFNGVADTSGHFGGTPGTKEHLLTNCLVSHSQRLQHNPSPGIRYRNLGKSGLRVSNVGLGTLYMSFNSVPLSYTFTRSVFPVASNPFSPLLLFVSLSLSLSLSLLPSNLHSLLLTPIPSHRCVASAFVPSVGSSSSPLHRPLSALIYSE